MNKIIVTRLVPSGCREEMTVSAMLEDGRLAEVLFDVPSSHSILKNIYIGKVQNIVKNINAAFIEFEKGCVGYYPLEELDTAIFTVKNGNKPLAAGDELLVQVAKEPLKTKAPVLTTNLNFTGRAFVLTTGRKGIGMSGRLSAKDKSRLKELVEANCTGNYGIIVRTNAAQMDDDSLIQELRQMEQKTAELLERAKSRTVFSVIQKAPADYLTMISGAYASQKDEIVTDIPVLYDEIREYLCREQPEDCCRLVLYEDKLLPLYKLYNLEKQLENARKSHVWLKSGAYLVIEQTEAFTVIDVNTGKFEEKKHKQDTFLKINLEAARECARQLRLRNLSGIILIDFINMEHEADKEQLMEQFSGMVHQDRVKTAVVDMTRLGIVEVTRKKERCSLNEALNGIM